MNQQAKYISIAAFVTGVLLGLLLYSWLKPEPDPCPLVDTSSLDSLSAAVEYHAMMEKQALDLAARYAHQRDSILNNPTFIPKIVYRNAVQKSLDAGGLPAVLDTLAVPASPDWRITR